MTEILYGGVCDGLTVETTEGCNTYYGGAWGNGMVAVYQRKDDGKLQFTNSFKVFPIIPVRVVLTTSSSGSIIYM